MHLCTHHCFCAGGKTSLLSLQLQKLIYFVCLGSSHHGTHVYLAGFALQEVAIPLDSVPTKAHIRMKRSMIPGTLNTMKMKFWKNLMRSPKPEREKQGFCQTSACMIG